jgi:hypothetical protein
MEEITYNGGITCDPILNEISFQEMENEGEFPMDPPTEVEEDLDV